MLKASEQFFTFPIRIYDPFETERYLWEMDKSELPPERFENSYTISDKSVYVEDIKSFHSAFRRGKTIEEVDQEGLDMTIVSFYDGEYVDCHWKRDRFVKEYDKHCEKLEAARLEDRKIRRGELMLEDVTFLFKQDEKKEDANTKVEGGEVSGE